MTDVVGTPDPLLEHPCVQRVRAVLHDLAVTGEVVVLPDAARTAALAAEQLGIGVGQIANSLVFAVPQTGQPDDPGAVLVLTSGAHRVDTAQVAALLGVERLDRADPGLVRKHTGFAIGGVAPVGHPRPITTLVDVALSRYDVVWAAAGHPRTVFPTHYDELLRITAGTSAEVAFTG